MKTITILFLACCAVNYSTAQNAPVQNTDSIQQFDTITLDPTIQVAFENIVKAIEDLEKQYKEQHQILVEKIIIISMSNGIKMEEFGGWTEDKKSILKKKE